MLHVEKMENTEIKLSYMHEKTCGISVELNAEVPLNGAEVVGLESAVKVVFELGDELKVASYHKYGDID